jgi:non-homologous end joining protein Ku
VTLAPEEVPTPEVADLMEALRASVEAAKTRPKAKSA